MTSTDSTGGTISVWKFGGTSVADHDRLRAVAQRMVDEQRSGRRVVAVLSAMGKFSDELIDMAYKQSSRPQLSELDALLSVGEQISCALAAMAVNELRVPAISFNGEQAGIRTDDQFGNARLIGVNPEQITAALDEGNIVLVTGFQGVSPLGDTTTLGRGGSDASAVAVAAGLGVGECEIFTDVPGVFTADPRVVANARRLDTLHRSDMLEMAEAGAGVLQPRSVELAAAHGIDIHLRSSFTDQPGTWIRGTDIGGAAPGAEAAGVTAVAHRNQDTLYSVSGVSPAQVLRALAARGAAIGTLQVSDSAGAPVLFTAPGVEPAEVTGALAEIDADVSVHDDLGSVSIIATGIARKPAITAAALSALEAARIDAELVTTTPGRLTVHVHAADVHDAVRLLHALLIEH
jgi:aspartate kinase